MDLSVKDIPRDIRIIDMTYMYFISPTQRNTLAEHKMFIFRSIIQKFKSTVRHFHLSLIAYVLLAAVLPVLTFAEKDLKQMISFIITYMYTYIAYANTIHSHARMLGG